MNRRAKRNKYKLAVRSLQNELKEYKEIAYWRAQSEKKVGVETLTFAIARNYELEYLSLVPKEKLKAEQDRMVLANFAKILMDRPDLLKREEYGSYNRFMMKVVKE